MERLVASLIRRRGASEVVAAVVTSLQFRSTIFSRGWRCTTQPGSTWRVLYLGPDRAGNLLEVVVIERDDGSELAIHAMKMRKKYERLLVEGGGCDD